MAEQLRKYKLPSGKMFEAPVSLAGDQLASYAMQNFPDEFAQVDQDLTPLSKPSNPLMNSQPEPGLLSRAPRAFAQSLGRGLGNITPGIRAGFADLVGDEEGFQSAMSDIRENVADTDLINPNPSSFAEVRKKYNEKGVGSAILETADLLAQGIGGSFGYAAPSLGVVAAAGVGAISAPVAVLALGGLAGVRLVQYFADQLDRADQEDRSKGGNGVSADEVNLGKQLVLAAGQTALDQASFVGAGLYAGIAKSGVLSKATNAAVAKTVEKLAEGIGNTTLKRTLFAGVAELVTETGQTAFERAAAGLPITPDGENPEEYQKAFDEYIETWVTSFMVGSTMGGVLGNQNAKANQKPVPKPGVDVPIDGAPPVDPNDPLYQPLPDDRKLLFGELDEKAKAEAEIQKQVQEASAKRELEEKQRLAQEALAKAQERAMERERSAVSSAVDSKIRDANQEARLQKELEDNVAERQLAKVEVVHRTPTDIQNLLDDRGVDFDSDQDKKSAFSRYLYNNTGKYNLEELTPSQLEGLYEKMSNSDVNPIEESDTTTLVDFLSKMRVRPSEKATYTEAEIVTRAKEAMDNIADPFMDDNARNVKAREFIDEMKRRGFIAEAVKPPAEVKPGAKPPKPKKTKAKPAATAEAQPETPKTKGTRLKIDRRIFDVIKDKGGLRSLADKVRDMAMKQRPVQTPDGTGVEMATRYPTFDEFVAETGSPNRMAYEAIKRFHEATGDLTEVRETSDEAPVGKVSRRTFERTKEPVNRWVVRDRKGNVRRIEASRSAAEQFIQGNADEEFDAPKNERGYLIREKAWSDKGKTSKLIHSKPVHFEPDIDAASKNSADEWLRNKLDQNRKARRQFLGTTARGQEALSATDSDIANLARTTHSNLSKQEKKRLRSQAKALVPKLKRSWDRIFNRYKFPVDPDGDHSSDAYGDRMYPGGHGLAIQMDPLGKRSAEAMPLRVKKGFVDEKGNGYGAAKLERNLPTLRALTDFNSWQEALAAMNDALLDPKAKESGEITAFPESDGRLVVIWRKKNAARPNERFAFNIEEAKRALFDSIPMIQDEHGVPMPDPKHAVRLQNGLRRIQIMEKLNKVNQPLTFILDQYQEADGRSAYHVFSAFAGRTDWNAEMYGRERLKTDIPKRGPDVDPSVVAAVENPASASKVSGTDRDAIEMTPVQRAAAARGSVVPPTPPRTYWSAFSDAMDRFFGRPNVLSELRRQLIDEYHAIVKNEMLVAATESLEDYVQSSASAIARLLPNASNIMHQWMYHGALSYVKTDETGVSGIIDTTEDQYEAHNKSMPVLVFDPEVGAPVRRVFESDMFNDKANNKFGGMLNILSALVSKTGVDLVVPFFDYARAVRAWNLAQERGVKVPLSATQIKEGLMIPLKHPEIAVAYSNMQRLNRQLVGLLHDTGILSQTEALEWLKNDDFTPFYTEFKNDGSAFDHIMGALAAIDPTAPYKGFLDKDGNKLADPVTSYTANATRIFTAAVANVARQRAIRDMIQLGSARPFKQRLRSNSSPIKVWEGGVMQEYEVDDLMMYNTLQGEPGVDLVSKLRKNPVLKWVTTKPSDILRETVTRTPSFIFPNIVRDAASFAWINGGSWRDIKDPLSRVTTNVKRISQGKEMSDTARRLSWGGVTAGWDHVGVSGTSEEFSQKFYKQIANQVNNQKGGPIEKITKLWDLLGRYSAASESATREIAYEHSFKETLDRLVRDPDSGMTYQTAVKVARAEALHQAREVLNFTRRGSNPYVRLLFSLAPFMRAKLQGGDLLGRAVAGYAPAGYKRKNRTEVAMGVYKRGAMVAAASVALAMLNFGDDDYEQEEQWKRDSNWMIPIPGTGLFFTIPIPFELGTVFKVIPEQIARAMRHAAEGDFDRGKREFARSAWHNTVDTLALSGLVPVAARPMIEKFANKSTFTNRTIDPTFEQMLPAEDRFGPDTTVMARGLSSAGLGAAGISPRFIDSQIYTLAGGLGAQGWTLLDHMLRAALPEVPNKPAPRPADLFVLSRFLNDEFSSGDKTEFFEFKQYLDGVYNKVLHAAPDRKQDLAVSYKNELAVRGLVNQTYKNLADIRNQVKAVKESNTLTSLQKRTMADQLERMEKPILQQYRKYRKNYDRLS